LTQATFHACGFHANDPISFCTLGLPLAHHIMFCRVENVYYMEYNDFKYNSFRRRIIKVRFNQMDSPKAWQSVLHTTNNHLCVFINPQTYRKVSYAGIGVKSPTKLQLGRL
jgi:hypothetical protein